MFLTLVMARAVTRHGETLFENVNKKNVILLVSVLAAKLNSFFILKMLTCCLYLIMI